MKGTVCQNCILKKCRFPAPVQSGSGSKGLSQEIHFPKPPPLTKLSQFIALGKNVKQNKYYKMQPLCLYCFLSIQVALEKETVQSLKSSKSDLNNLHTIKYCSISKDRDLC